MKKLSNKNSEKILKRTFTYLIIVLSFALSACKKENMCDCLKGTGRIISENRNLPPFTDIQVGNNRINVSITQDNQFSVTVEAGENLIGLVTTEVSNGRLYIENRNKCNFMRSFKKQINIYIHMPRLQHIWHEGSGIIQSTNTLTSDTIDIITKSSGDVNLSVNCYRVSTHIHNSSDITVSGSCNDNICYATGNGFLYSQSLSSSYGWIYANTTGEIFANVSGLLIVAIKNSGDVYYAGNPSTVQVEQTGSGKLIRQ